MVDGYRFLNDRVAVYPLYPPGDADSSGHCDPLDLYEPRLRFIQRLLEALTSIIDLKADGKTIRPNEFRIKNLNQWLGPGGGAADIIAHAASRCNLSCRFCYNRGAPSTLRPEPRDPEEEYKEIQERIKHYVPASRLNVFPNMGSPAEALAHPHILDILGELRQKTAEPFRINTNGSVLTPEMIRALENYKPIYLDISLNSASPKRRKWLMGDPEPQIALSALGLLKEARIPYSVVIVPWPFPSQEIMLDDLRKTVSFATEFEPTLIQISLPGYSRAFSEKVLFDLDMVWGCIKSAVQEMRSDTNCPIVIRPGLYEEYTEPDKVNDPVLIGVIKNSPLAKAGLRRGDRIYKVNGLPVKNRPQARSLLTLLHESDLAEATITVQRNKTGQKLDLTGFDYPYAPESVTHLGAVFSSSGIPLEWTEKLREAISSHSAEEVLLLTSSLVRPSLEMLLAQNRGYLGAKLHIRVPRNHYFGGNIFMGDLMVVEDFIKAIETFILETKVQPDLVIIPSSAFSLSGWGRDLTARVYLEIERRTKVPVDLIECDPIFD